MEVSALKVRLFVIFAALFSSFAPDCSANENSTSTIEESSNWIENPPFEPQPFCPETAEVYGKHYFAEIISPGVAQVRLLAQNGCSAEDRYIFYCRARSSTNIGEGEWIADGVFRAPSCD